MRRPKNGAGFTIIELLIVFAVIASISLATIPFISGKQSSTNFNVGIRQVDNQINSALSDVSTGAISIVKDNLKYQCTTSPSGLGTYSFTGISLAVAGTSNIGSNFNCQMIGEEIFFSDKSLTLIPLSGLKYSDTSLTQVASLQQSIPCPMYIFTNAVNNGCTNNGLNLSYTYNYSSGMKLEKYNNNNLNGGAALALVSVNSISNNTANGSGSIDLINLGITGNTLANSASVLTSGLIGVSSTTYNTPITLCFSGSGTSAYGILRIGSNNSPTNIDLTFKQGGC